MTLYTAVGDGGRGRRPSVGAFRLVAFLDFD